jgi:hypothetical protein
MEKLPMYHRTGPSCCTWKGREDGELCKGGREGCEGARKEVVEGGGAEGADPLTEKPAGPIRRSDPHTICSSFESWYWIKVREEATMET